MNKTLVVGTIAVVLLAFILGGILLLHGIKQPAPPPAQTAQKSISLTSPQGTEQWEVGSRHSITWNSVGVETVRISPAVGGKGLATSEEIDASLGAYEDFVVPDMSGFGTAPPYEVTILIFDAKDPNASDKVTFTAIEPFDTSGWQTYRSEEFGFEVKYPPNMMYISQIFGAKKGISLLKPQDDTRYIVNERIEVTIGCEERNALYKPIGTAVKNGITFEVGEWAEGATGPNYYGTVYKTQKGDTCYRLSYSRGKGSGSFYSGDQEEIKRIDNEIQEEDEKNAAIFEQILSTFRFVEDDEIKSSLEKQIAQLIESEDSSVMEFTTFEGVEYAVDEVNERLFVHNPGGFEGERFSGELRIFDGKNKTVHSLNVSGFVFLPNGQQMIISRSFNVDTWPEDKTVTTAIDENKLLAAANEVGVSVEKAKDAIYGAGGKPTLLVNGLFLVELETYKEKPLSLLGGQGGIYKLKDGTIIVSNGQAFYGEFNKPYYKLDIENGLLTPMSETFVLTKQDVEQPSLVPASGGFLVLGEVDGATLVLMNREEYYPYFYIFTEDEFVKR